MKFTAHFFAHGSKLNCAWSLWLPSWKSSWNQQATFRHLSILTFVVYIHIIFGLIPSFDVLCLPSSQNLCWKSCWNQFHHFYWWYSHFWLLYPTWQTNWNHGSSPNNNHCVGLKLMFPAYLHSNNQTLQWEPLYIYGGFNGKTVTGGYKLCDFCLSIFPQNRLNFSGTWPWQKTRSCTWSLSIRCAKTITIFTHWFSSSFAQFTPMTLGFMGVTLNSQISINYLGLSVGYPQFQWTIAMWRFTPFSGIHFIVNPGFINPHG